MAVLVELSLGKIRHYYLFAPNWNTEEFLTSFTAHKGYCVPAL